MGSVSISFPRRALRAAFRFARGHVVLSVSFFAALATMAFVPPDAAYAGYIDLRTIACLFGILAVAGALKRAGAFEKAARLVVRRFRTSRTAIASLVVATAVLSMFATNDMALIMMLPLAGATLIRAGWVRLLPFTFVMLGLTANLGGMIVPFGNPQNLYLYSAYSIRLADFLAVMALPFAASMALVAACCAVRLRTSEPAAGEASATEEPPLDRRRCALYAVLFALCVGMVLRVVPAPVAVAAVVAGLAVSDRGALRAVDYPLLLTFVCFFVFAGNLSRIPEVDAFLSWLAGSWPLAVSAGLSQVISNVPAAVLLSHFTDAWQPLLVGVNIGGAGTLVGSLASLITLQQYSIVRRVRAVRAVESTSTKRFVAEFFAYNVSFLIVLFAVCSLAL